MENSLEYTATRRQPVGKPLPQWRPCLRPPTTPMEGRFARLERVEVRVHARELYDAYATDGDRLWTYMPYGPFDTFSAFETWLAAQCGDKDPICYVIRNLDEPMAPAVGLAAFMRIVPSLGLLEIGRLAFSPALRRTRVATEAIYLMMRRVFDELGYRRFEWKCDSLNAASRRAAERLGFRFEGIFRQATIVKGHNRDTAWHAVTDGDWPACREGFETWLSPENFDASGRQRVALKISHEPA